MKNNKPDYEKCQVTIDYMDGTRDVFVYNIDNDSYSWDGNSIEIEYDGDEERSVSIPSIAIKKIETKNIY